MGEIVTWERSAHWRVKDRAGVSLLKDLQSQYKHGKQSQLLQSSELSAWEKQWKIIYKNIRNTD